MGVQEVLAAFLLPPCEVRIFGNKILSYVKIFIFGSHRKY